MYEVIRAGLCVPVKNMMCACMFLRSVGHAVGHAVGHMSAVQSLLHGRQVLQRTDSEIKCLTACQMPCWCQKRSLHREDTEAPAL